MMLVTNIIPSKVFVYSLGMIIEVEIIRIEMTDFIIFHLIEFHWEPPTYQNTPSRTFFTSHATNFEFLKTLEEDFCRLCHFVV